MYASLHLGGGRCFFLIYLCMTDGVLPMKLGNSTKGNTSMSLNDPIVLGLGLAGYSTSHSSTFKNRCKGQWGQLGNCIVIQPICLGLKSFNPEPSLTLALGLAVARALALRHVTDPKTFRALNPEQFRD
jgi:hypothetical protein